MGKSYTLSFDSTLYYGGGNNNKRTYIVDWSFLPLNKQFKVNFTYMSVATATVLDTASVMTLHVNLGTTDNYYANSTGLVSTQMLGSLKIANSAGSTNGYYYADRHSNCPVYVKQRPAVNTIEVMLHTGLTLVNYTAPIPNDYILTLYFEECDDY